MIWQPAAAQKLFFFLHTVTHSTPQKHKAVHGKPALRHLQCPWHPPLHPHRSSSWKAIDSSGKSVQSISHPSISSPSLQVMANEVLLLLLETSYILPDMCSSLDMLQQTCSSWWEIFNVLPHWLKSTLRARFTSPALLLWSYSMTVNLSLTSI